VSDERAGKIIRFGKRLSRADELGFVVGNCAELAPQKNFVCECSAAERRWTPMVDGNGAPLIEQAKDVEQLIGEQRRSIRENSQRKARHAAEMI
jgi:hypothetical protein